MTVPKFAIPARINTLLLVTLTDPQKQRIKDAFAAAAGDWDHFAAAVTRDLGVPLVAKLKWANTLGDWSIVVDPDTGVGKDDTPLVKAILGDAAVTDLRSLAVKYGPQQLFDKLKELSPGAAEVALKIRAAILHSRLYGFDLAARLETLFLVEATAAQKDRIKVEFTAALGDWAKFAAAATDLGEPLLAKLKWANTLGAWSAVVDPDTGIRKDDTPFVKVILADTAVTDLRGLALKYGPKQLIEKLKALSSTASESSLKARAATLRSRLYSPEPTAVFARMIEDDEIKIKDDAKPELVKFLRNTPAFRFETINGADLKPDTPILATIPVPNRPRVIEELKELDALQAGFAALEDVLALSSRLETLFLVPLTDAQKASVKKAYVAAGGNRDKFSAAIAADVTPETLAQLKWANTLGDWSAIIADDTVNRKDDTRLVKTILGNAEIKTLRDLARYYSLNALAKKLHELSSPAALPATAGSPSTDTAPPEFVARARLLRSRLYVQVPTPVLHRMIVDAEIPLARDVRDAVVGIFAANLSLDLAAVTEADLADDKLLVGVDPALRPQAVAAVLLLKQLERLAPTPEAAVHLYEAKLTTASNVLQFTRDAFVERYKGLLGEGVAKKVYAAAQQLDFERRTSQPQVRNRIRSLHAFLGADEAAKAKVAEALARTEGSWSLARDTIDLPPDVVTRLDFANQVAGWAQDRESVVAGIAARPEIKTMADIAKLSLDDLARLVAGRAEPDDEARRVAKLLRDRLFADAPSAVVVKMIDDKELPFKDEDLRKNVRRFFANLPKFDIAQTPVQVAFATEGAFAGIDKPEDREAVKREVEALARTQALAPSAMATLKEAGLTSAFRVSEIPHNTFVERFGPELGGADAAAKVHDRAVDIRLRNENALMAMRDAVRGTGFALLDGYESVEKRVARLSHNLQQQWGEQGGQSLPNFQLLFGSIDTCECGHCNSVYSPSSYFVELLNFLRNNNLGKKPIGPGVAGTPLARLFCRRPDLGWLALTCENTNTVLPYIDLANEVMESFVVHLDKYRDSGTTPATRCAKIDVFNVDDETTGELMAQPQHINYNALCILSIAVYPFTLPYHQPIDSIRASFEYFKTTRHEVMDAFRKAPLRWNPSDPTKCFPSQLTKEEYEEYRALHRIRLNRAVQAEFLGMTEDEYVIICREGFWKKRYYELKAGRGVPVDYEKEIGLRKTFEYYGFPSEADMLKWLPHVKDYLLKRTGITYAELVDLVQTRFVNQVYPQGKSLQMLLSVRARYQFLQSLVDWAATDVEQKYRRVMDYLLANPPHSTWPDDRKRELRHWVHCHFETVGKIIVLSRIPGVPVGRLVTTQGGQERGELNENGTITSGGKIVGMVQMDANVVDLNGKPFTAEELRILNSRRQVVGWVRKDGLFVPKEGGGEERWVWKHMDTCDVGVMRLEHLDGTALTSPEYDRIHRFIRLWRKLGWTIDETDKAIVGMTPKPPKCDGDDDCPKDPCGECGADCGPPPRAYDITADLLGELAAIKKVVARTGLDVIKQLTFWSEISTAGEPSLYKRLFLTHNLRAIDDVFKADVNGLYLSNPAAKVTGHIPVLMAALGLKEAEIGTVLRFRKLADALTLETVSALYRHALLAKALAVRPNEVESVVAVFGDPFVSASATLELLELWSPMETAGLSFGQLRYVVTGADDAAKPVGLQTVAMLQAKKTIFDGLTAIDAQHADLKPGADPTEFAPEVVEAKASLLFDQALVGSVMGLLEGTTIYSTNAPKLPGPLFPEAIGPDGKPLPSPFTTIDSLRKKLKYVVVGERASIQVTGILTRQETEDAKRLVPDKPEWVAAIDRVGRQPIRFFNLSLAPMFDVAPATSSPPDPCPDNDLYNNPYCLLAGDRGAASAGMKRRTFLTLFLPYLRKQLARKLIVATAASLVRLTNDRAEYLLANVLRDGDTGQSALKVLAQINRPPSGAWTGYLLPNADLKYRFFAYTKNGQPPPFYLEHPDGTLIEIKFATQQEDPNNVWYSEPVDLKKVLYRARADRSPEQYEWQPDAATRTPIPSSALFPEGTPNEYEVFRRLDKSAMLVNAYKLDVEEIIYWQDTPPFDFNRTTFAAWKVLQSYAGLRDTLPAGREIPLVTLFRWARDPQRYQLSQAPPTKSGSDKPPPHVEQLARRIAQATGWDVGEIDTALEVQHFDLRELRHFRDHANLVTLQTALRLRGRIGVGVARLFRWAEPSSQFKRCREIAADIRAAIRAGFDQESWEKVIKPLNDRLRTNERDALVNYLLVQKELIDWGVTDANSLFEFFLIDVKMESCMETSRMKQAISSVQQFIDRALMGLEVKYGVAPSDIDRKRWEWMQKYRVWEANRKVFLYPENWLRSELRDDKSPYFEEYQSECLQADLTPEVAATGIRALVGRVNEVSNLLTVGLYVEEPRATTGDTRFEKLYVFGRTRTQPFKYYYRVYERGLVREKNEWQPWREVAVEVPAAVNGSERESFVVPVVWRGRPLLFVPQFDAMSEQATLSVHTEKALWKGGNWERVPGTSLWVEPPDRLRADFPGEKNTPSESWSISLGYSELSNAKWSSKVVATQSVRNQILDKYIYVNVPYAHIRTNEETYTLNPAGRVEGEPGVGYWSRSISIFAKPHLPAYRFVTRQEPNRVSIACFHEFTDRGGFTFDGQELVLRTVWVNKPSRSTYYQRYSRFITRSLQEDLLPYQYPEAVDRSNYGTTIQWNADPAQRLANAHAPALVSASRRQEIDDVFAFYGGLSAPARDEAFGRLPDRVVNGKTIRHDFHELKLPNALYNWEIGFHAPMLACEMLLKAQRFDDALKMIHHIFDPLAQGTGTARYWKFPPFRETDATKTLQQMFNNLQAGVPDDEISAWRDNPFRPHVVARGRPSAYMKWVVVKYIEILIAYGDYYFRQNTLETLPLALQRYVTASHIFGPPGQVIPKRGVIQPQSYNSLVDQWDAFGNAHVQLELRFPNSSQGLARTAPGSERPQRDIPTANAFGFGSTLYFCIPDNPRMRELRATIDDRLYKIRHCQDINGVFRRLPLFEPAIDPALLVQATAMGLSLASVLNDLSSPVPNYRFVNLLQRAVELCSEVKTLGNAFLAAKEKKDAEVLARLRGAQETGIQKLMLEVRKLQAEEGKKSLDALVQSRKAPVYRLQHYLKLIGGDLAAVPGAEAEFAELQNLFDAPIEEGGLKLSSHEKQELDKAKESSDGQLGIGVIETLAGAMHFLPTISANIQPFGCGVSISFGGGNIASGMQAVARAQRINTDQLSYQSSRASRLGGFHRQIQDRIQQANNAGYEIKNLDKQILAQRIRVQIAEQEVKNQQKQIENSAAVEEYLRTKYSNQELYAYMEGELRDLHYQAYKMAYDLAKKAERVFQFERGLSTSEFIKFGYWEPGRDGLFAGERLYQALKQLEAAYIESRGYDFEVTKHVSLRQVSPLALLALRETGKCDVEFPEALFDMDYPGHYKRRIKSVALSVPCVVGPHTSLNCTLRLREHRFRVKPTASSAADYLPKPEGEDDRFMTVNVPVTSVAVSEGRTDSGVFELNFRDERFVPFEGAGAVSKWSILLPEQLRQFDYNTISDVVFHIRYTAVDGGEALAGVATGALQQRLDKAEGLTREQGFFAVFDLRHDFATEWTRFAQALPAAGERRMALGDIAEKLPYLAARWGPGRDKVVASDVFVISRQDLGTLGLVVRESQPIPFDKSSIAGLTCVAIVDKDVRCDQWHLQRSSAHELSGAWLVVRLKLRG